jgi:hypothetical protein
LSGVSEAFCGEFVAQFASKISHQGSLNKCFCRKVFFFYRCVLVGKFVFYRN